MSIWILAIALLLVFGAIGFAKGAIRAGVSLAGILIGVAVAIPLGRALKGIMGPIVGTNPVWLAVVPPLIVFALVYLVFVGLSFFVHHKVAQTFKFKHDEVQHIRWERMNRHVGVSLGLLSGAILFLYASGLIYAAGYLTTQVSAGDNDPAMVRFINSARQGMAETGFDKAAARFQPASKQYYESADVLGFIYHNPAIQTRLARYPYYLSLAEKTEFQEIRGDKEYKDMVFGKAPITDLIDQPRTQTILSSAELMDYLKATDLKDLKEYLRTGVSPKYAEQEIIGVWSLDKHMVLTFRRKANPDIKAREMRAMREELEKLPPVTLTAMPDGRMVIQTGEPKPAETAEEEVPVDPMIARYGPQYARSMQPQQPAAPVAPPAPEVIPRLGSEATWKEEAGHYSVSVDANGRQITGAARVKGDEMTVTFGDVTLVFVKE
jgi:hypothetical protein